MNKKTYHAYLNGRIEYYKANAKERQWLIPEIDVDFSDRAEALSFFNDLYEVFRGKFPHIEISQKDGAEGPLFCVRLFRKREHEELLKLAYLDLREELREDLYQEGYSQWRILSASKELLKRWLDTDMSAEELVEEAREESKRMYPLGDTPEIIF